MIPPLKPTDDGHKAIVWMEELRMNQLPVIEIECVLKTKKVQIRCTDNGKGIEEDIRDKVFIPKFSTKAEGSGIGLAIAKRGVEHAGGSIWFESAAEDGTTFFLEFPLTD